MGLLNIQVENQIATLKLCREEKLNALNTELFNELYTFFLSLERNKDIKVVILTGSSEKAFSAGADLQLLSAMDPLDAQEYMQRGLVVLSKIASCHQVTIAAIEGYALGGGLELALTCDMIVASEHALLGMPEAKVALMPGFGATQRLLGRIGKSKALEMMLFGNKIAAVEALKMGLIDQLTKPGQALSQSENLAKEIAKNSFETITGIKKAVNFQMPALEGYHLENQLFFRCYNTQEAKEKLKGSLKHG